MPAHHPHVNLTELFRDLKYPFLKPYIGMLVLKEDDVCMVTKPSKPNLQGYGIIAPLKPTIISLKNTAYTGKIGAEYGNTLERISLPGFYRTLTPEERELYKKYWNMYVPFDDFFYIKWNQKDYDWEEVAGCMDYDLRIPTALYELIFLTEQNGRYLQDQKAKQEVLRFYNTDGRIHCANCHTKLIRPAGLDNTYNYCPECEK